MRLLTFAIILIVFIAFEGCKSKTEKLETAESIETALTDSVKTDTTEDISPVQKSRTVEPKQLPVEKKETPKQAEPVAEKIESYRVTFLEIGSKSCIPCKMMQPIMKEIEDEYRGIVKVEFHDLMEDRQIGSKYNIRVMPTQVFLDSNGKEFFRHEGFYPKVELAKMLDDYLAKLSDLNPD